MEAWLLAQPGVAQASVIGLPDALRGLRIHAVLHGRICQRPRPWPQAAGRSSKPLKPRAAGGAGRAPGRKRAAAKTDTATLQAAVAQALAGQPPAALQPWR